MNEPSKSAARFAVSLTLTGALASACGGAAHEPAAPALKAPGVAQEPETDPVTVEEAQAAIARAAAELGGRAPSADVERSAGTADAHTPKKSTPATESAPAPPLSPTETRCASPCRALGSMRRAVAALCRMTSAEDARCIDAQRTLKESEVRAVPCTC